MLLKTSDNDLNSMGFVFGPVIFAELSGVGFYRYFYHQDNSFWITNILVMSKRWLIIVEV